MNRPKVSGDGWPRLTCAPVLLSAWKPPAKMAVRFPRAVLLHFDAPVKRSRQVNRITKRQPSLTTCGRIAPAPVRKPLFVIWMLRPGTVRQPKILHRNTPAKHCSPASDLGKILTMKTMIRTSMKTDLGPQGEQIEQRSPLKAVLSPMAGMVIRIFNRSENTPVDDRIKRVLALSPEDFAAVVWSIGGFRVKNALMEA